MWESNLASSYSLKVELGNFEKYGIKEREFSELFKYEPIYTLP